MLTKAGSRPEPPPTERVCLGFWGKCVVIEGRVRVEAIAKRWRRHCVCDCGRARLEVWCV
jgi:hypothetical protein